VPGLQLRDTSQAGAECPSDLGRTFIPAAYQRTDPNVYGNYDPANRPYDGMTITRLVIHAADADAVTPFQDPTTYASANYVVLNAGEARL
jgi:hypothetical protein